MIQIINCKKICFYNTYNDYYNLTTVFMYVFILATYVGMGHVLLLDKIVLKFLIS